MSFENYTIYHIIVASSVSASHEHCDDVIIMPPSQLVEQAADAALDLDVTDDVTDDRRRRRATHGADDTHDQVDIG